MRRNETDEQAIFAAAQIIWELYQQADGATYNFFSGNLAGESLYAVSIYGDRTRDIDESDFSIEMVETFIRANWDLLSDPENSVGIWLAVPESRVYLDISITLQDRERALALAREHGEQAICNLFDLSVEYADAE